MKKIKLIVAVLVVSSLFYVSCASKPSVPKAGSAKATDMLTLIPKDAAGVFVIDVGRAMQTEAAKKALAKEENSKKLQEFIQQTGVDPQKDIYLLAIASSVDFSKFEEQGAVVVNLRYQKDKILAKIKEKISETTESDYNGIKILQTNDPSGKPISVAFLDESNIAAGSATGVKAMVDVYAKKAPSLLDNKDMMSLIDTTNKSALVWGTISISKDAADKLAQNSMAGDLKGLKAVNLSFDYKNNSLVAEIILSGMEEAKNKQLADMLSGLKALGSAGASKEPKLGELLNKIEISSVSNHVRIFASIPESLIEELSKKIPLPKGVVQDKDELN